jgi:hypothetical protein
VVRSALVLAVSLSGCSGVHPKEDRHEGWPLRTGRERVLVAEGVSIMMPPANGWPASSPLEEELVAPNVTGWRLPKSAPDIYKTHFLCWRAPPDAVQSWLFDARCDWSEPSGWRSLFVGVRRHAAQDPGELQRRIAEARALLGDRHPANEAQVNEPSCVGVDYEVDFESQPVRRRICFFEKLLVVLSATAGRNDSFREAEQVFRTLQVAP